MTKIAIGVVAMQAGGRCGVSRLLDARRAEVVAARRYRGNRALPGQKDRPEDDNRQIQ
jgi:hypothetical protein